MPGKFVFPGGRVDKTDNRVPVAAPIPKALEANLLKGSPKITPSRARSLAIAAIREACEETGLCLGRKSDGAAPKLEGPWKPFSRCRPAARSIRTVPDRARHHPARPGAALRHQVFHRRCLGHRPSGRGRDPCRGRTGGAGLGRDRIKAARRPASDDQECPERTRTSASPPDRWPSMRRCRSSISTAAGCTVTCCGRRNSEFRCVRHSGTRLLARARNDGKLCRPREGACEGNGFRSYTFFATERVANAGGVREPIPRSAQCIRSSAVRSIPLCSNQTFDQAALACNRYAAIRLLASACHSATALALIRPRTGRNPKPWFLRWALIRSMSFRSL